MNSATALSTFMNPFLMWSRLAWKIGEMAVTSIPVIGDRTGRLVLGNLAADPRVQHAFDSMGREKGEAAWAAGRAVGLRMLLLNQQFAAMTFNHVLATSAALMSIAASRSPGESAFRQTRLVHDTLTRSVAATSKLSHSTADLAHRALKPVHARVRKNVRRLTK